MNTESAVSALRLSLVKEVAFDHGDDTVTLTSTHGDVGYGDLSPGLVEAFGRLADGRCDRPRLEKIVLVRDGLGRLSQFRHLLDQWVSRCFVEFTVWSGGKRILGYHPTVPARWSGLREIDPTARYVMSRFAYGRRENDELVIESPLTRAVVTVHDPAAASLWALLSEPRSLGDVVDLSPLPAEAAREALRLMMNGGAIIDDAQSATAEAEHPLVTWDFHDLLFHARSRVGRHNYATGATFRFAGSIPPLPMDRPSRAGTTVPLVAAARRVRSAEDESLTAVMESRRSVRLHGDDPLTVEELGEFLFRVARVRATALHEVRDPDGALTASFEIGSKPYPSGGGLYELELYPVVSRCRGLGTGLYHYDSKGHRLVTVGDADSGFERLLEDATTAAGIAVRPQVLVVVSARFGRVAWKYESIAYAAILKNVGALYQSMYLVATAMGLAPCALGSGNSELFARLADLDYATETSVGEFMLGSMPPAMADAPTYITNIRPNTIG